MPRPKVNEVTPQHVHQNKILKQDAGRKQNVVITDRWLELTPDKRHVKGGKLVLKEKTQIGITSTYKGREKIKVGLIKKYQELDKFKKV